MERKLDIITDTDDKYWYELDGDPETRQGPFNTFVEMTEHLDGKLEETGFVGKIDVEIKDEDFEVYYPEEKESEVQELQSNTGNSGGCVDVPSDQEVHVQGSPDVPANEKETQR